MGSEKVKQTLNCRCAVIGSGDDFEPIRLCRHLEIFFMEQSDFGDGRFVGGGYLFEP